MDEKLRLQWNDFQDNVRNAFSHLRGSTDFAGDGEGDCDGDGEPSSSARSTVPQAPAS